jgi:hypothetical protein
MTPSCSHTARAPIAIASSTCAPAASARRKMSTTSTPASSGRAVSRAAQRSPRISSPAACGLTGMMRLPRLWRRPAMRWLSRCARGEQPTTAHVRRAVSRSRIVSSRMAAMPPRIVLGQTGGERAPDRGRGDGAAGRSPAGARRRRPEGRASPPAARLGGRRDLGAQTLEQRRQGVHRVRQRLGLIDRQRARRPRSRAAAAAGRPQRAAFPPRRRCGWASAIASAIRRRARPARGR